MSEPGDTLNRAPIRLSEWAFLVVCAVALFAGRWRMAAAPLHSDMCTFALIGHEMIAGRPLYTDLWDRKPPLLYLTFAAAETMVGYGRGEILLVNVAAACLTLCGVFAIGRRFGPAGGYFAAALWTLCATDLYLYGNRPDPEALINACTAAAVALMLRPVASSFGRSIPRCVGIGVLLAAVTLYKHNAALLCGMLLLGYCVAPAVEWRRNLFRRFTEAVFAGSVVLFAWLVFLGHAYFTARLPATLDVLFRQNLAYSGGSVGHNVLVGLRPDRLFPPFMAWAIGPALLLVVFVFASFSERKIKRRQAGATSRGWVIVVAWAIGAWMTIVCTGKVYPHYYQLWLPMGCVCGGWAAAELWGSGRWNQAIVVIVLLCITGRQLGQFFLSPQEWVRRQFPDDDVAEQNAFGAQLGQLLRPDESFYELGEDNTLYFLSRHSPPTGLLFIDPLIYGNEVGPSWRRLMADFAKHPPDMVILSSDWLPLFPPDSPIFPWLRANYDPYSTPIGRPIYRMYVRRGGRLERRLSGL